MNNKSQANFIKSFILISVLFVGLVYAFSGGTGTLANPYQITNCTELQSMNTCLGCNYTLNNNIDCSATSTWNWNGSVYQGFNPIGDNAIPFKGSLNGQNNTIINLFIDRDSSNYVGLFGYIGYNSLIKYIGIDNVVITGNDYVGGLVGYNYKGKINYSYSLGQINGNNDIGGLVGNNYKAIIDNSYSTGEILGNQSVGGLVGYLSTNSATLSPSILLNSYALSDVIGVKYVGGLVGFSYKGYIDNSYSKGNVNGNDRVGGLVGNTFRGIVNNSYSVNNINGSDRIGGISGYMYGGTVDNTFFDGDLKGITNKGGLVGEVDSSMYSVIFSNVYWNNISNNSNSTFGLSSTTGWDVIQNDISYFYNCSNEPMNSWDTINDWNCTGTTFPYLIWQVIPSASVSSSSSSIFPFTNIISVILTMGILMSYFMLS